MSRILGIAAALILVIPFILNAQGKRPMAIDDLIGAVRVSEPQLSPDGRRVLFVRTTTVVDSGRRNSDIWSVPADGSAAPVVFIGGDRSENSPRITPDGNRVVFISSRDGAPQIYIADADGRNV